MNTSSRLTFGKYKGIPIKNCHTKYLMWVVAHLWDTDFHNWATLAKGILEAREKEEEEQYLIQSADEFLKEHGVDPSEYFDKRRRKRYKK